MPCTEILCIVLEPGLRVIRFFLLATVPIGYFDFDSNHNLLRSGIFNYTYYYLEHLHRSVREPFF